MIYALLYFSCTCAKYICLLFFTVTFLREYIFFMLLFSTLSFWVLCQLHVPSFRRFVVPSNGPALQCFALLLLSKRSKTLQSHWKERLNNQNVTHEADIRTKSLGQTYLTINFNLLVLVERQPAFKVFDCSSN